MHWRGIQCLGRVAQKDGAAYNIPLSGKCQEGGTAQSKGTWQETLPASRTWHNIYAFNVDVGHLICWMPVVEETVQRPAANQFYNIRRQEGHHRSEVLWCHLCRNSGLWRCTSLIRLGTSALVSLLGFDSWVFSNPTAILGIVTYLWEKWSRLVSILYEFLILINIHIYFAKLLYQNSHSYYYISSKLCLLQVMWHVTSALTHCNDGQGIHLEMVRDNLGKYSRLEEQGFG